MIKIETTPKIFEELSKIKYVIEFTSIDPITMNDVINNLIKKYKKIAG